MYLSIAHFYHKAYKKDHIQDNMTYNCIKYLKILKILIKQHIINLYQNHNKDKHNSIKSEYYIKICQ